MTAPSASSWRTGRSHNRCKETAGQTEYYARAMKEPRIRESGLKPESIAHLATGASLAEASNVVLPGPPGTGPPYLGGARFNRPTGARKT